MFHRTDRRDPSHWWRFEAGADRRHSLGILSDIESIGLLDHPVVHIAYADAQAYAHWMGKKIPTEAEFEFAARGGLGESDYAWVGVLAPGGACSRITGGACPMSKLFQDGWERTPPLTTLPANG